MTKQSRALITGITGQDGSYLADFLLKKNYQVFGLVRDIENISRENLEYSYEKINFIEGNLADRQSIYAAIEKSKPTEVYNLAGQTSVYSSFKTPEYTTDLNAFGVLRILESIREFQKNNSTVPDVRFYQASSSEMFGNIDKSPQNENTRFYPRSPYGVSKLYSHWITKNYRESYNMFNVCGILFNHESERRHQRFVTRKITKGIAEIYHGLSKKIYLGNINACRDWGYAPDYVEAMWLMLQQNTPSDYVIATGVSRSIKQFLIEAFQEIDIENWSDYIEIDKSFLRSSDVNHLVGDATKAKKELGWQPKIDLKGIINKMVWNDIKILSNDL
jgi:GDPmannose 4,6-dehydratase